MDIMKVMLVISLGLGLTWAADQVVSAAEGDAAEAEVEEQMREIRDAMGEDDDDELEDFVPSEPLSADGNQRPVTSENSNKHTKGRKFQHFQYSQLGARLAERKRLCLSPLRLGFDSRPGRMWKEFPISLIVHGGFLRVLRFPPPR